MAAARGTEAEEERMAFDTMFNRYRPTLRAYLIGKLHCSGSEGVDLLKSFFREVIPTMGPTAERRHVLRHSSTGAQIWSMLMPLRLRMDLILTSHARFDRWRNVPGTIYFEAANEGRFLYEAHAD